MLKNTDIGNIYNMAEPGAGKEICQTLLKTGNGRIERIISDCCPSPEGFWYDQDESEWVLVLEGSAVLNIEGKTVTLEKGGWVFIKKHQRHRVESTSKKCLWLCVFFKET